MTWFEKSIFKYLIVFLIVFFFGRLIFIIYNFDDFNNESLWQICLSFIHGIRMDLSAMSYISPVAIILLFISYQFKSRLSFIILEIFLAAVYLSYFSIVIAELPIYDEWQTKLNSKAVSYLNNINEVWNTASWEQIIATFTLVPLLSIASIMLTKKLLKYEEEEQTKSFFRNISVLILAIVFGFLGARGGFYQIPLSASAVFYSSNRTLNFATVNSAWNLGYGYYKEKKYDDKNKYKFFSEAELETILKDYQTESDSCLSILTTKNPNIILVLFESWSADLVDSLDATYGIMSNWREIRESALNFDKCYATGRHSEEGMLAVFSGFPSLASSYLMGFTDKNAQLPSITKKLDTRNYQQSFFFGGDLGYANIKSFFYQNPFYKINDILDFPSSYKKAKLGYQDEALYSEMFNETKKSKQPFFIGGFTTSTHAPYDVPLKEFKEYTSRENKYMNSAYYADSCLGNFYNKCKNEEWFENTLFVFVSDHSHPTPVYRDYCSPGDHRIVFMLAGGALKDEYRGKTISKIVSQIDIPKTLLYQLDYNTNEFIYSRNVLDSSYKPLAYFSGKTCQGLVNTNGFVKYSLIDNKIIINNTGDKADSLVSISKALLQKSYTQFQNY